MQLPFVRETAHKCLIGKTGAAKFFLIVLIRLRLLSPESQQVLIILKTEILNFPLPTVLLSMSLRSGETVQKRWMGICNN